MRRKLSDEQIKLIYKLRKQGYTCRETAEIVGCHAGSVQQRCPGRIGKIPNNKLREAFLESGVSAMEVARRIGWYVDKSASSQADYGDMSRVLRTLGIYPDISSRTGARSWRKSIDAETAGLIAEAIGLYPWEVGA